MQRREPITLNFYDKNDEIIKTYSKTRVTWGMWKNSLSVIPAEGESVDENALSNIRKFVVDFFDGQFTLDELIEHTDIEEVMICAYQISHRVLSIMAEQGIELPEVVTVTE